MLSCERSAPSGRLVARQTGMFVCDDNCASLFLCFPPPLSPLPPFIRVGQGHPENRMPTVQAGRGARCGPPFGKERVPRPPPRTHSVAAWARVPACSAALTTVCLPLTLTSRVSMAFASEEITAFVESLPPTAFQGAHKLAVTEWANFVLSVDENPKSKHDLFWYLSIGRRLAELFGSTSPLDFSDAVVRDMIVSTVKPFELPYDIEGEKEPFKSWKVLPAQVTFALRIQGKCAKDTAAASGSAGGGVQQGDVAAVAGAIKQLADAQANIGQKSKPKGLSFNKQDRIVELGLQALAADAIPSEEILAKFEAAGKIANEKGRMWIGSTEGEDLQEHHRPNWSRTPIVEAVLSSDAPLEDRVKQALDVKRKRTWEEKISYPGYATFVGHLLEWGVKVVMMKVCTMTDLVSYLFNVTRVAEEHGGVRTAYQYDILQRQNMAKALESGESNLTEYFNKIDKDTVKDAKAKIENKYSEAGRSGASKGGKGGKSSDQSNHWQPAAADKGGTKGKKGDKAPDPGWQSDRRVLRSPARGPRTRSPHRGGHQGGQSSGQHWPKGGYQGGQWSGRQTGNPGGNRSGQW